LAPLDATIESAQGVLGAMTTLRRHPQGACHAIGATPRATLEDLAAAAAMLRTSVRQRQRLCPDAVEHSLRMAGPVALGRVDRPQARMGESKVLRIPARLKVVDPEPGVVRRAVLPRKQRSPVCRGSLPSREFRTHFGGRGARWRALLALGASLIYRASAWDS
jgi:hypothetical protein